FADLGVLLGFGVESVVPVQIYNQVSDPQQTNSTAYALVVITLAVTALLFYGARWLVGRQAYSGGGKGAVAAYIPAAGASRTLLIYGTVFMLTMLAVLPTLGVIVT